MDVERIALVVPCYNEEAPLHLSALRALRLESRRLELVLVDDGSRDRTRAILEELGRERPDAVHVVALDGNQGKAEAVRRGVTDALSRAPDAVGFWDADLATPFSELPAFVDVFDENPNVDMVIGSRVKLMGRTVERHA